MAFKSTNAALLEGLSAAAVSFTEDSAPVALAQGATFTSLISNFGGLTLEVLVNGGLDEDQLTLISTNAHTVQAPNGHLLVDGVLVGTVAGGTNGTALTVTFNDMATVDDANLVLNALAYVNTNTAAPNAADRSVVLTLIDQKGFIAAQQTLTVDVIPQNDAPVLTPTTEFLTAVNENGSRIITFADLQKICSISDPDGDTLSFKIMTIGSGTVMVDGVNAVPGTTIITASSKVEWFPQPNVTGPVDGFSVAAFDGQAESKAWGQVRAIVADVDPQLVGPATISVKGALANNTIITTPAVAGDFNGLTYTLLDVSQDTGVTGADGKPVMKTVDAGLAISAGSGTVYVADGNKFAAFLNSTLVIRVGVDDEDADTTLDSQLSIRLSIGDGNEPPYGSPTGILSAGTEDKPYVVTAAALLSGFYDPEKGNLKVQGLTADHGAVADNGDGTFTITPEKDFNGKLTLTYDVADPAGKTLNDQQRIITFAAVNDAPVIQAPGILSGQEGHSVTLTYAELLKVAPLSDAENDTLSYKVMALGSGTLTVDGVAAVAGETLIGADATIIWTPVANTSGVVEAFSLAATDGKLMSSATVPVRVDLTDINPSLEGPNVVALTENSPKGTVVAKYIASGDTDGLTFGFEVKDENDQPLPPNVVDGKAISADGAFAIDIKTGVVTVYDASKLDFETKSSFDLRVTVDDEDADTAADSAIRLTVYLANANDAPTIKDLGTALSGMEGQTLSVSGSSFFTLVEMADQDKDTLSLQVASLGSGTLLVNGVAAVAGTTLITSESVVSWTPAANATGVIEAFSLAAYDGKLASTNTVPVKVNVADVNPVLTGPNAVTLDENTPAGTVVAQVQVSGDKDGLTFGFSSGAAVAAKALAAQALAANNGWNSDVVETPVTSSGKAISADGAFAIDIHTGEITVNDPSKLDFETHPIFNLTVTVDDEDADTVPDSTLALTIKLNNVNDAPVIEGHDVTFKGQEGQAVALTFADLLKLATLSDQDQDPVSFQVAALGSGTLTVNGVAAVAGATLITADSVVSWTPAANATGVIEAFSLAAHDGKLASTATVSVKVDVADVDPVLTGSTTFTLAENSAAGTEVARMTVSGDQDGLTFGFADASKTVDGKAISADGAFAIDIKTGIVTVNDASKLDFETNPAFKLTVTVDDEDADTTADSTLALTINLTDVNEAPVIKDQAIPFDGLEGQAVVLSYESLLKAAAVSDQDGDTVSYKVMALSAGTLSVDGVEAVAGETLITAASVVTWTPPANTTGKLDAFTLAAFDGKLTSDVTVPVHVNVADVNPVLTGPTAVSLAENSVEGTVVARMDVSDDKDGLTFGFLFAGKVEDGKAFTPDGAFAIDTKTGVITVADASKLDFETHPVFNLNVTVDDEDADTTADSILKVAINLTDVNEKPVIEARDATWTGVEGQPISLTYADLLQFAAVSDPDKDVLSFKVASLGAGTLVVDGVTAVAGETIITEKSAVVWTPADNTTGSMEAFALAAFDGKLASDASIPVHFNVVDLDPRLIGPTTFTLAENSAAGTIVAEMAVTRDMDGLTYGFVGGVQEQLAGGGDGQAVAAAPIFTGKVISADGAFAIDMKTGIVTVHDASKLDFEANPSLKLTVTVDDEDADNLPDSTLDLTINLTDVNEAPAIKDLASPLNGFEGKAVVLSYESLLKAAAVTDPDGDAVSYKVMALSAGTLTVDGVDAVAGETLITASSVVTWTPPANTTGTVGAFTLAAFDGTLTSATTVPVQVAIADVKPLLTGPTVFTLAENSLVGTEVAKLTISGDQDGLTFGFENAGKTEDGKVISADGAFAIDVKTGIVTVHDASKLDFETNPSFKLTVTVDDEDADSLPDSTLAIAINLTNVNEAPVLSGLPATAIAVTSGQALSLPAFTVTDPDSTLFTVTLSAVNGTLGGLVDGDAGTAGIQLFGTAADIQAMLALSTFTPIADGEARVDLTVSDGAGGIATGSLPFLVSTPSGSTVVIGDAVVTTKTETQADGTIKQTVTVPVVADTGDTHAPADIPLVKDNADTLLSATLPTGVGLTATGAAAPQTTEQSLQELIAQIKQHTPEGSAEQSQLTGGGTAFLQSLATDTALVVQTLVLTGADTAPAGTPIVLSAPTGTAPIVLVVDASALPAGTQINLQNVAFAAVVGPVTLGGGSGAQVVYADDAAQTIMLGAGNDELHAGGGNDIVGSAGGDDRIFGEAGDDIVFGGPGRDLLHGGLGTDTARFDGNRADYEILQDRGVTVVRSLADPTDVDTLVNVESISFADGKVDLTVPASVSWIAALYSKVLGRQADLAGIQHYAGLVERGVSAGDIAIAFLTSPEAIAKGTGAAADDLSVEQLYRTLFGREPDADGLAYHKAQLAAGVTLAEVAAHFVHAPEMQSHLPTADALDFIVGDVTPGLVTGTAGAETLQGGSLDDKLVSNGGADFIDGRTGDDTAVFAGHRADYSITQEGVHWTIKAATAPAADQPAVLVNVEHVQFDDMTIDLTPQSDLGWISALYTQVLGRQGDESGLMAHLADYQSGMSKGAVALSFMISPEAVASGHGATSAKDLTADMVYQALLGHAATEADHAAYGAVENDPASLAAALMDSKEMQAHILQQKDMDFFI